MNDLQKTEFEILKCFVSVCDELNLTYFLVCGSALGAAKYNGFIPWDDDIDVALPRTDYEKFLANAPELLPEWCFLQNYRTEPEFHLIGTKLRDSRTTFVEYSCETLDINHGVFIDVFPLDSDLPIRNNKKKFLKMQEKFEAQRRVRLKYRRFTSREIFSFRKNFYYLMYKLFGMYGDTSKYMKIYEKMISSGDTSESDVLCNYANSISTLEYAPKWHYGKGTWAIFEGLKVRIPENADAYLTQKYGDWRADLPPEQQFGHHFYEICDLDHPYTDYFEKLPNGKIRIKP